MAEEHDLLLSHRFQLKIEDTSLVLGFQEISGLRLSAAFEPLQVGGYNDGVVMLRTQVKDTGKLTLKRGKYAAEAHRNYGFFPGLSLGKFVYVEVLNADGKVQVSYHVSMPVVESVELAPLQAEQAAILIESCTLMHHGIFEKKQG